MPHALLLSPDDQAVAAITGVLEEMSVTYERPLDGVSAAQKLNSQSFDLVLVDCENLPAAKLIFDVCRRGNNGHNPIPIAIVDGRAGLPTAFRLGAEQILTKPVAKDQARSTVRGAVGRVRKDAPNTENLSAPSPNVTIANPVTLSQPTTTEATTAITTASSEAKPQALAQAAAVGTSQLTAIAEPAPGMILGAASLVTNVDEPGDETQNVEESIEQGAAESGGSLIKNESSELSQSLNQPVSSLSSFDQPHQAKKRSPLVALLVLALAAGAFYAAWQYQPGFRAIAQPQINRALALVGVVSPQPSTPVPAKSAAQPLVATMAEPKPSPVLATDTTSDPTSAATSPTGTTAVPPGTPSVSNAPVSSATPAAPTPAPPSAAQASSAPVLPSASSTANSRDNKNDARKATAAVLSPSTPLPAAGTAIILSSKGAEKRLLRSIPPKYPTGVAEVEATVVLQALVDEDGRVANLRLVEGNAALAAAAIDAVQQWRYRPYLRDGKAQPFQTVVIVDFQRP